MGWEGHDLNSNGYYLYTRGGLKGIFICKPDDVGNDAKEIQIYEALLIMLAADHVRSERIGQLENASDYEILGIEEQS